MPKIWLRDPPAFDVTSSHFVAAGATAGWIGPLVMRGSRVLSRTYAAVITGGGVALALSLVLPLNTNPDLFGGVSYRCGWFPITGGTATRGNPVLVDACRSAAAERSLWWIVGTLATILVIAAVGLIVSLRSRRPVERFEPLAGARLALVVVAFGAPLLGFGLVAPLVIVFCSRKEDAVVRDFAGRAFDLQLASLLGGAALVVATVGVREPAAGSASPGLLMAAMSLVLVAIVGVSIAAIVAAAKGQPWVERWRPVFFHGRPRQDLAAQ